LTGINIEALCNLKDESIEGVICSRAVYSGDLDFEAAQYHAVALND
jgi:phosphoribosylformimino-5-aminoimidazole carboxamide ribotide isomerase